MRTYPSVAARVMSVAGVVTSVAAVQAETIRSGAGSNAAAIQAVVDQYRADLGGLNPNNPGTFVTGRREINWDAVPDNFSSPNLLPADFFNGPNPPRSRGVVFSTPGSGFLVSADSDNPSAAAPNFADIDASYAAQFGVFSPQRLFIADRSNVTDVSFFVAGTNIPATSRGFGAVFSDVDVAGSTKIEFFGAGDVSLGSHDVPAAGAGSASFSFLGVFFEDAVVTRVRITSGSAALAPGVLDVSDGGASDLVVMDDFIYGEPVPEPASLALLVAGALLGLRRR